MCASLPADVRGRLPALAAAGSRASKGFRKNVGVKHHSSGIGIFTGAQTHTSSLTQSVSMQPRWVSEFMRVLYCGNEAEATEF